MKLPEEHAREHLRKRMVREIEAAQVQLREIARDLLGTKYRLMGVHASVPLSPSESDPLAEVDVSTDPVAFFHGHLESLLDEIESVIHGVLELAPDEEGAT